MCCKNQFISLVNPSFTNDYQNIHTEFLPLFGMTQSGLIVPISQTFYDFESITNQMPELEVFNKIFLERLSTQRVTYKVDDLPQTHELLILDYTYTAGETYYFSDLISVGLEEFGKTVITTSTPCSIFLDGVLAYKNTGTLAQYEFTNAQIYNGNVSFVLNSSVVEGSTTSNFAIRSYAASIDTSTANLSNLNHYIDLISRLSDGKYLNPQNVRLAGNQVTLFTLNKPKDK